MYINFYSYRAIKGIIKTISKYVSKCADQRALSLQGAAPAQGF